MTTTALATTTTTKKLRTKSQPRSPLSSLRWPALRFRLLDEMGEPMDIGFRRVRIADGVVVDSEDIRHEEHDGVGAVTALLEDRGFTISSMPAMSDPEPPGWLRRVFLLRAYLTAIRGWPQRWKREPDWTVKTGGPSPAIALFDVATTTALLSSLKAASSGLTAGVVACLDRVAAELLLEGDSPRRWMVPVNMRTTTRKAAEDYQNIVSSLLVPFPSAQSPQEVHGILKDMLRQRWHWGTSLVSAVFSRLSHARLRRLVARFDAKKTTFGYVSNVGVWPAAGTVDVDTDDSSTWAIIPPVGRRGPLASVLMIYRGRLAISLHVHGCLGLGDADVKDLLRRAASELLREQQVVGAARVYSLR